MTATVEIAPRQVEGVRPVRPTQACNAERCEVRAHIGVFFDGTGNNRYRDEPLLCDSNVARLFRSYPDNPEAGHFRMYIPGVGTRFPEIGEDDPDGATYGLGFGEGGEGRILFGLLHVMNSMHRAADHAMRMFLSDATVKSLCSQPRWVQPPPSTVLRHRGTLQPVGLERSGGLLSTWPSGASQRPAFFAAQGARLADKIARSNKSRLVEVFIDVFGFSRGAAEARAFCNWLDDLFQGDSLFGVRAQIRFLGIFDTVASVGMPASSGIADGHLSWADAPLLRIPPRVRNCQHYVAAHENRASFPLELARNENGQLQGNSREYVFPGMHSDVGGGYAPGEQGRLGDDDCKLSQVPLNHMFNAARTAKVPLDKAIAAGIGSGDPFAIAPELQRMFDDWLAAGGDSKPMKEWLLPYLAWRYQVRDRYARLPSTLRANGEDRDDLIGANATLQADVLALENPPSLAARLIEGVTGPIGRWAIGRDYDQLAPEAPEILRRVKAAPAMPATLATLFADYCHDSFAGFRPYDTEILGLDVVPGSWEPEGYLRWRRHYRGSDRQFTRRQPNDQPGATALAQNSTPLEDSMSDIGMSQVG